MSIYLNLAATGNSTSISSEGDNLILSKVMVDGIPVSEIVVTRIWVSSSSFNGAGI